MRLMSYFIAETIGEDAIDFGCLFELSDRFKERRVEANDIGHQVLISELGILSIQVLCALL